MTSKNLAYRGPEWMLKVAIDDEFRVIETAFSKDGAQYEITRRATLKERLAAAKDASAYYAPKLSTVEHNVMSASTDKMNLNELQAELDKLMTVLNPKVADHGGQGSVEGQEAQAEGSDSEGVMGEPDQQATDARTEDQEAQS